MRVSRLGSLLASVLGLTVTALVAVPSAAVGPTVIDGCIRSVPEPRRTAPVSICYSLFRPDGADSAHPVPMVMHSHGWAGARSKSADAFANWLEAGFGVISFDQRGFGESGGKAHVEHPNIEGQDVQRLVDLIAGLDWVARETPGDPVLGAIGGSYGGGYQFVGAFSELRDRGSTRFDALVPEITWWDLKESLAPQEVVRTAWVVALYAAGARSLPLGVTEAFVFGAATGTWPKGDLGPDTDLDEFFAQNGPAWHVARGRLLDIPVLFGQGTTDNLFNLNQAFKNFSRALTPAARARSMLVAYHGGHALPSTLPAGITALGDPCSKALGGESFGVLAMRFLKEELQHASTGLHGRGQYHLATPANRCITVSGVAPNKSVALGTVLSTTAAGLPVNHKIADGPLTVAGTPFLDAKVTSLVVDGRMFFALAVGTTPGDARIVGNNMLPLREGKPVVGAARTIELPGIAVDVPAGQSLYLTMSPLSDMSFGHGSRVPGVMILKDAVVRLPIVAR